MASLISGDHTVAASATKLAASRAVSGVRLVALGANAAPTYCGGSTVTTGTGFLLPEDVPVEIDDVDDLADIYIIGTAADHVRWLAFLEE